MSDHPPNYWRNRCDMAEADVKRLLAIARELAVEVESLLQSDAKGMLHDRDCIGLHGYPCKSYCLGTRELVARARAAGLLE